MVAYLTYLMLGYHDFFLCQFHKIQEHDFNRLLPGFNCEIGYDMDKLLLVFL